MKHSDKKVAEELKRQAKAEKEYNRPFKEAREMVKQRERDRLSGYDKFKRDQKKRTDAEEMLVSYLSKKG